MLVPQGVVRVKKLGSETRQQTVLLSSYYELLAKSLPLPGPVFLSIKWGQLGMLTRWSLWVQEKMLKLCVVRVQ